MTIGEEEITGIMGRVFTEEEDQSLGEGLILTQTR